MTRVEAAPPPTTTRVSLTDLIDRLARFEGTPEQFLLQLLAVQCHTSGAEGGAILHMETPGKPELLAIYPALEKGAKQGPPWLGEAVKHVNQVVRSGRTTVVPLQDDNQLYGQGPANHVILLTIKGDVGVRGVMAYHLTTGDKDKIALAQERLELTASLLALYEMRLSLHAQRNDSGRLKQTIEVHSVVNDYQRFLPGAMALCNEFATRWNASRVSVGFNRGRYVHLLGMSHTEKVIRKTALSQAIESAMEECIDQDVEVLHPAPASAPYVNRAASELAQHHGPCTVLSLPLRREGEPVGVVTIERATDKPFSLDEVETLRLACDLCAPRLIDLQETDRWFGAKLLRSTRTGLATVLGPRHTWAKLIAIALIAAAITLCFAKGPYRADATFTIESRDYRVMAMPFQGFLQKVHVEPGDHVAAGDLLATIDTSELVIKLAQLNAEYNKTNKEYTVLLRDKKIAEAQIKQAEMAGIRSQIDLLEHQIAKGELRAPIAGVVIEGDLLREQGKRFELGESLFRVAPLQDLYAELLVPERDISNVRQLEDHGEGTLALASHPGDYLPFEIDRIHPVAEVAQQHNVFRVIVRLKEDRPWLRPGNQGVAKIELGERHYAWMWARPVINWTRMKFWI